MEDFKKIKCQSSDRNSPKNSDLRNFIVADDSFDDSDESENSESLSKQPHHVQRSEPSSSAKQQTDSNTIVAVTVKKPFVLIKSSAKGTSSKPKLPKTSKPRPILSSTSSSSDDDDERDRVPLSSSSSENNEDPHLFYIRTTNLLIHQERWLKRIRFYFCFARPT